MNKEVIGAVYLNAEVVELVYAGEETEEEQE